MASTFSTNKNLELPGNGDYVDTWNVPVNADLNVIDAALGGTTALSLTTGASTLSVSQYQKLILSITGDLVADVTYSIPSTVGGFWIVRNATTNAFSVTIANTGGGANVVVPQGSVQLVYSDGTNIRSVGATLAEVLAIIALIDVNAGAGLTGGGSLATDVTLAADFATSAQWRSNTNDKVLEPPAIWGAMAEVTLTDGATISWDMGSGFDFVVTLGGNRTMAAPTNTKVGQKGRLIIQQDGTGSRTMTWNSVFDFANGTAPTLSTTASAKDYLYYDVRSSTEIFISLAGRAVA
jgi:hypothetical protein